MGIHILKLCFDSDEKLSGIHKGNNNNVPVISDVEDEEENESFHPS